LGAFGITNVISNEYAGYFHMAKTMPKNEHKKHLISVNMPRNAENMQRGTDKPSSKQTPTMQ